MRNATSRPRRNIAVNSTPEAESSQPNLVSLYGDRGKAKTALMAMKQETFEVMVQRLTREGTKEDLLILCELWEEIASQQDKQPLSPRNRLNGKEKALIQSLSSQASLGKLCSSPEDVIAMPKELFRGLIEEAARSEQPKKQQVLLNIFRQIQHFSPLALSANASETIESLKHKKALLLVTLSSILPLETIYEGREAAIKALTEIGRESFNRVVKNIADHDEKGDVELLIDAWKRIKAEAANPRSSQKHFYDMQQRSNLMTVRLSTMTELCKDMVLPGELFQEILERLPLSDVRSFAVQHQHNMKAMLTTERPLNFKRMNNATFKEIAPLMRKALISPSILCSLKEDKAAYIVNRLCTKEERYTLYKELIVRKQAITLNLMEEDQFKETMEQLFRKDNATFKEVAPVMRQAPLISPSIVCSLKREKAAYIINRLCTKEERYTLYKELIAGKQAITLNLMEEDQFKETMEQLFRDTSFEEKSYILHRLTKDRKNVALDILKKVERTSEVNQSSDPEVVNKTSETKEAAATPQLRHMTRRDSWRIQLQDRNGSNTILRHGEAKKPISIKELAVIGSREPSLSYL